LLCYKFCFILLAYCEAERFIYKYYWLLLQKKNYIYLDFIWNIGCSNQCCFGNYCFRSEDSTIIFVMHCEKPTKVASATTSSVVRILPSHFNKNGEKLKSSKDWILRGDNHKILFYVTTLNMSKFLYKEVLKFLDDEFDPTFIAIMDAWNVQELHL
jgi:hypothetical protein